MLRKIREWLHKSQHVHRRAHNVESLGDAVDLIDRFLDAKLSYELEWDDFISWTNEKPGVEEIRKNIGTTEPFLFSGVHADRLKAIAILVEERNRVAALIGLPARSK